MKIRRWTSATAIAMLAISALSACGGSDSPKSASGLEKTNIKVGVLPIPDAATIYLARSRGYFKAEGLNVTPTILNNGSETISRVVGGGVDFAYSAYIPIVQAAAQAKVPVKVVTDGYQGRSNLYPLITLPNSPIKNAKQLTDKKIGVINTKGFPSLLTDAALKNAGVAPTDVHLVEIQYPQMPAALQNHSIDAAFMTEPYLSQSQQQFGARVIVDTMSGPTADLPVGGYISSQKFIQKNPKTVAAFQRAMAKAQAAATDRNLVGQILPTYVKGLSPQVAQTITLGTYPASLSKTRLQRVADLMTEFGTIKQHFDVSGVMK